MTATPPASDRLANAALDWYATNGRTLAFRRTAEPWAVLVSEVMAQQTQALRAADAWVVFIERYPTPAALAAAPVADVIRAWRGLGYNRRAVALHAAAIRIVEDHDGCVPDTIEPLTALPGIGPYTARAVLAIAFGRTVAALDTNILRVLDRVLGRLPVTLRDRQSTADRYVPAGRSADWTHALMDLGATVCRKRDPRCDACPLLVECRFARTAAAASHPHGKASPRFESTNRWLRGRILDHLRGAPDGAWVAFGDAIGEHPIDRVKQALIALGRERLVEVDTERGLQARLPV